MTPLARPPPILPLARLPILGPLCLPMRGPPPHKPLLPSPRPRHSRPLRCLVPDSRRSRPRCLLDDPSITSAVFSIRRRRCVCPATARLTVLRSSSAPSRSAGPRKTLMANAKRQRRGPSHPPSLLSPTPGRLSLPPRSPRQWTLSRLRRLPPPLSPRRLPPVRTCHSALSSYGILTSFIQPPLLRSRPSRRLCLKVRTLGAL